MHRYNRKEEAISLLTDLIVLYKTRPELEDIRLGQLLTIFAGDALFYLESSEIQEKLDKKYGERTYV